MLTKDLIVARQFNFYFLLIIGCFLFFIITKLKFKIHTRINIFLFSIILLPWWFGSLYSLGEVFSSVLFTFSVLLIKEKPNIALILMGISVVFGKLLQILLVGPFIFFYFIVNKKINLKNFLALLTPYIFYIILILFKVKNINLFNYFQSYFEIIYNHQSSGLSVGRVLNYDNFISQLIASEFNQWTLVTKLRVFISPVVFSVVLIYERKNLKSYLNSVLPLIASIAIPYIWFIFFSQTKWIRYSQHFLYIIIFFSLIFIFYDFGFKKISRSLLLLNFSIFLSSHIYVIIFLFSLLLLERKKMLNHFVSLVLILNLINLLAETRNLVNYDFLIESCNSKLNSIDCVNDYLPYSFSP